MEQTESGLSISPESDNVFDPSDEDPATIISDELAAQRVQDHISRLRPDSQSERIIRSLVNPRHDYHLDDSALLSLFSAANELFFAKRLDRRVAWDWSHQSSEQYHHHIVGTTALRKSNTQGGYETLIILSTPILKDTTYNRRLLISTFLHEMIHSYLFVACGLKAKEGGGHSPGFHKIAGAIDDWIGEGCLHLRNMEADLERYRGKLDTPWRTRSLASHATWNWSAQEDFGNKMQADLSPPPHVGPGTLNPNVATYIPPSYYSQPPRPHCPGHYSDGHYQHQPPSHHYPQQK